MTSLPPPSQALRLTGYHRLAYHPPPFAPTISHSCQKRADDVRRQQRTLHQLEMSWVAPDDGALPSFTSRNYGKWKGGELMKNLLAQTRNKILAAAAAVALVAV